MNEVIWEPLVAGAYFLGMLTLVFGMIVYLLVLRDTRGHPPVWVKMAFGSVFLFALVLVALSHLS
ncbi:hypothetical protein DFP74_5020 [Nocardiopsis sp. Huas11]|uniref:hypothetical protein n=1 Tax=Nocardiopsis sp. Huas11 TaxID=2183912 RepID=UPI000EAD1F47|nr:hypothetical protein [Nocardiopsis sp. Huas11]RKS09286.1 hypothetical protein DFP74_5020 [Nocardiopsis sp. Huas11]